VAESLKPFDLLSWIAENRDDFRLPVGNKVIWPQSEFIAFVNGANARNDFHINPTDEIFFQVKGHARVDLMVDGQRVTNPMHEGQVLLVPAGVPHAPRRPADTWAFIFERPRRPDELDRFAWFCETCDNQLHEIELHISDIETQLAPLMDAFNASVELRTCTRCRDVLDVPREFVMEATGGAD
jgi:3-hydroxyanthranilate 3,4-dioxygenase